MAMTRADGVTYFFDQSGYLRWIEDRVGNKMRFDYENVPLTDLLFTQCGAGALPLIATCPKRVTAIVDASGIADATTPNRAVHIAYVPFSLTNGAAGMIDTITDHAGRTTDFDYDSRRRLTTIKEAAGTPDERRFALGYEGTTAYLTSITDPRNNTSRLTYEPQGPVATAPRRATGFVDRSQRTTQYAFGAPAGSALVNTRITDPKQRVTEVHTDNRQRVVTFVDARNKRDTWTWGDAVNKPTRHVEAAGTADEAVTKWEWGSLGQLERAYEPFKTSDEASARSTDYNYQLSNGAFAAPGGTPGVYDLTELVRPKGNTTTWQVSGQGQVLKLCEPDTACRVYTYGPGGVLTKETDPQGESVQYLDHDASGLPQRTIDERANTWQKRYDSVGNVLAIRDPRGTFGPPPADLPASTPYTARYTYDKLDRRIDEVVPKRSDVGQYVHRAYQYDVNDNAIKTTDGTGADWVTTYTPTDQVKTQSTPSVAHHEAAAPASEVTRFEYDATDQVSLVRRPLAGETGTGFQTRYAYDQVDQRVVERRISSDPAPASGIHQLVTSWAYDLRGNQTGSADPNTNVEVDDTTAAANATTVASQRVASTYDAADRKLTQTEDPGGLKLTTRTTYDDNDNVETVVSPRGNDPDEDNDGDFKSTYTYDDRDLLTEETDPLGRTRKTTRRDDGRPIEITSPRGTQSATDDDFVTEMTYDEAGEIESTTMPRHPDQYGHSITIQYDRNAVGDPVTIHDGRGTSFDNKFLDTGELRQTDRPSWWSGGAGQDQRALPKSKGEGDFGAVTPQQMPGLMPRAGTTTLDYDNELRLLSVTDTEGNTQRVEYDKSGRVIRREIPFKAGSAPQTCAERNRAAEPTAGPIVMTTAYDLNGNRRFMRDGRCQESTWNYDQFDRSVTATEPAGWTGPKAITKLSYDRNGNTVKSALPRDPDHKAFERMTYDDVDRLASKIEPFDTGEGSPRSEWRYRYDASNNKTREIRPRSQAPGGTDTAFTTKLEYDEADQLDSVTNSAGHETTFEYDADGNQTKVTAPGAARSSEDPGAVRVQVTRTEFDGRGLPWVQSTGTGADARTTVTEYDGNGNLRRTVNPRGVDGDRPRYGDIGRDAAMSTASRASWNATVNEYTEDGLLRARYLPWDDADGGERWKQTHAYNARGWPSRVSEVYDWAGSSQPAFETRYEDYLPTGWVGKTIDKPINEGATQTLLYSYDHGGDQTSWSSEGKSRRVQRTFFPNGQLEQRKAIRRAIDGSGPALQTRTYDYERNPAGELTKLIDHDPPRIDPPGPTGPSPTRTTSIVRDVAGRVASVNETWAGGRDTVYDYGIGGLIDDVSVDGKKTTTGGYEGGRSMSYDYDILDRVKDVAVKEAAATTARRTAFTYWPSGAQKQVTKTNDTVEQRFYDTAGRFSERTVNPVSGASQTHRYDYDTNANRKRDERGTFAYNARNQLTSWSPSASGQGRPTRVSYDPAGDGRIRTKAETFEGGASRTTTNRFSGERLTSAESRIAGATGDQKDLKYDYDNYGSLLTIKTAPAGTQDFKTTTQYTYDPFERLLSSRDDAQDHDSDDEADGPHAVYCYDALDRRDRKVTNINDVGEQSPQQDSFDAQRQACANPPNGSSTLDYSYLGLGEQLTRENTPDGPRTYDYTPDGERLGQRSQTKFRPYETDAQGSVVALEHDNGGPDAVDRYELDPYGDTLNEDNLTDEAKDNPFRYQGFYLDAGTGTYDMEARAYRPSLGRFLTQDRFEDPAGDLTLQQDPLTNNRYAFAAANPTSTQEYDGHCNNAIPGLATTENNSLCQPTLVPGGKVYKPGDTTKPTGTPTPRAAPGTPQARVQGQNRQIQARIDARTNEIGAIQENAASQAQPDLVHQIWNGAKTGVKVFVGDNPLEIALTIATTAASGGTAAIVKIAKAAPKIRKLTKVGRLSPDIAAKLESKLAAQADDLRLIKRNETKLDQLDRCPTGACAKAKPRNPETKAAHSRNDGHAAKDHDRHSERIRDKGYRRHKGDTRRSAGRARWIEYGGGLPQSSERTRPKRLAKELVREQRTR